jgi:hypothetical protein
MEALKRARKGVQQKESINTTNQGSFVQGAPDPRSIRRVMRSRAKDKVSGRNLPPITASDASVNIKSP